MSVQKPLDMRKSNFNSLTMELAPYTKNVNIDRDIPRQAYKI